MLNLLVPFIFIGALGFTQADHDIISDGCDTNKTCFQFAGCALTTSPSSPNLATIYTIDDNTVQFQLQYDNAAVDWIAIGLSTTQSMANTYVFMCVRPDANDVNVQERFATGRTRPGLSTSLLTTVETSNEGSLFNCTFTSPVIRTPQLNLVDTYYVLLAWGPYSSGNIQQHTGRCFTSATVLVTDAPGVTMPTTTPAPTEAPGRCNGENTCISFSDCATTTLSNSTNIASFVTESDNSVRFSLEHTTDNATGWIAIGFSTTPSMLDLYIYLCHRVAETGVIIEERYALGRTLPSVVTPSELTPLSYNNSAPVLSCTFTSPVTANFDLNNPDGYYVLLARGPYNTEVQFHGAYRCLTGERMVITTAVGASSGSTIMPAVGVIYAMVALLIASYIYL